jgi:hypothetical protein
MLSLEYNHEVESTRNPCVRDNSQRYLRFPPNILNVEKTALHYCKEQTISLSTKRQFAFFMDTRRFGALAPTPSPGMVVRHLPKPFIVFIVL